MAKKSMAMWEGALCALMLRLRPRSRTICEREEDDPDEEKERPAEMGSCA